MPLIVMGRGAVVLRPERPVMSRLWTPPPPRRAGMSHDACHIQRALLDGIPTTRSNHAGRWRWLR